MPALQPALAVGRDEGDVDAFELAPLISPITVITLCKPLSFPCNSRLNLIQAR